MHNLKINFFDFIPKTFFNLQEYLRVAQTKINTNYLTTAHVILNDKLRFLFLYRKLLGKKKIFIQQHGSDVNSFSKGLDVIGDYEKEFDYFISWGKTKKIKKNTFLPTPQIKKYNYNFLNKSILFISTGNYYLLPTSIMQLQFDQCIKRILNTTTFLGLIKKNLKKKIIYQPHNDGQFKEVDLIKEKFPDILFSKKKAEKYLKNAKLVVLNNFSTMFLKSIGSNIPTIVINNDFSNLNNNAKKIYKLLEENNIIFRDPKKAAKFTNNNFEDICLWWNKSKVQKAVNKFRNNYAYASKNWFNEWCDCINKLI